MLRTIIIGMGVQGHKRRKVCGKEFVAFADPNQEEAKYDSITDVPTTDYDAAIVCTPWDVTYEVTKYLVEHYKHVIVEKPLWTEGQKQLQELFTSAGNNKVVLYTAYNHRFEPSIIAAKELLDNEKIGKVYFSRMFYGYGSAKLVKQSSWQQGSIGILGGPVPHLLDITQFIFGGYSWSQNIELVSLDCFENETPDHIVFKINNGDIRVECEGTYLSWKNHFSIDIYGEKGSIHVNDLAKWGDCWIEWRERVLPSGVPTSQKVSWLIPDQTWQKEWDYFKKLVNTKQYVYPQQINDMHYNYSINKLLKKSKDKKYAAN